MALHGLNGLLRCILVRYVRDRDASPPLCQLERNAAADAA